jgi:predicted DNA-binding protein
MKNATFTKAFSFSISPEVFARIKRITDNEQTSMAEWVRDAINSALNNIKREEDTM